MRTRKRRKLSAGPPMDPFKISMTEYDLGFFKASIRSNIYHATNIISKQSPHNMKPSIPSRSILGISTVDVEKFNHDFKDPRSEAYKRTRRKLTRYTFSGGDILTNLTHLLVCLLIFETLNFVTCQRYSSPQQRSISNLPSPFQLPQRQQQQQVSNGTSRNIPEIVTQKGGTITKDRNVTLTRHHSPLIFTKDIIVKHDAKLTIEAGTELLFEKRKGIIVYGILDIIGNSSDQIKLGLLKANQAATTIINSRSQINIVSNKRQVRLVDGDLPSEGRVQIKFNEQWHSLCTQSKNLTTADIKVLCLQVGFQDGHLYKWFLKRNETTFQIMSKTFQCTGQEFSIMQCPKWSRIRAGGGVCDYHSDIGIRCSKKLALGDSTSKANPLASSLLQNHGFWRGLEFIHSDTTQEYLLDGQMKQKISRSRLQHVVITEAGLDDMGNATAAVRVYGQPPRMSDVDIKNSVYGVFIEDADDGMRFSNIRLTNNFASPIFINTSWGKVVMDGMHIENNGGDGIRVVRYEKLIMGPHDFCKFANLGTSQTYPVILSHEQQFLTQGRECCQEFISQNQLTIHFPVLRSTPNNLLPESDQNRRISVPTGVQIGRDANLVIYDDYRDEYPFRLTIRNETRAQSIVSRSGRLKVCYEPASFRTVLFTIQVVADDDSDGGTGIAHDVRISNSYIRRNEGRGIWIDNQRSGCKLWNTTILQHNYLSGIHVENGTGEVIIQGSRIENNTGHGLYITLAGGYYHIDNSSFNENSLKGVMIDYDIKPELVAFNHTMHMGYSLISANGESGLFVGNVCRSDAFWNISMSNFVKNGEDAIVFQSCYPTKLIVQNFQNLTSRVNISESAEFLNRNNLQEVLITHNKFHANLKRAIHMAPLFFVKSFIKHNLFRDHPLAVIYINNQAHEERLPSTSILATANVRISSNRFYANRGRYVTNIGLLEQANKQVITFTKNYLEDNHITEPYMDLKPRSRVSAVVVVSSSHTRVIQNKFVNPLSAYEIGSHLEAHSKIINATSNFWGYELDAISIYRRIFDRKNRYNLAQIEFIRYLLSPEDLEYKTDLSFEHERDKFPVFKNGTRLGGEVKGFEELPPDTYTVVDDIFIRPGGHLILNPGTVMKFLDGVGIMVQGRLDALGQASSQIMLTSAMPISRVPQRAQHTTTTTPVPYANAWVSYHPESGGLEYEDNNRVMNESLTTYGYRAKFRTRAVERLRKRQAIIGINYPNPSNVRLSHTTMGRVEVQIDGVWGPVCDYNFDIDDAAVVCQQLGMILNKDDWLLDRYQYSSNEHQHISSMTLDALMTNLRCDPTLDTDITACKAEVSMRGDFDGTCNSEVGIRCFPPSWSGMRFGMGAEMSILEHVIIQRAGMFDYASFSLKPALQIDFNRHMISDLVVKSNSDSGLGIMWNDVIGRHQDELFIAESKFMNNEKHGIELRSRGLIIKTCTMSNNRRSGLDYNPSFTQTELRDLLSWLRTPRNSDNVVTLSFPLKTDSFIVPSSEDSFRFFIFQKSPNPNIVENFSIGTDQGHMLSIQLLNPIHRDSSEQLNMTLGLNPESPLWDYRVNTTSFPMISPGYKFHFNYSSGSDPHGNIILYVRSRYNNRDLKGLARHIPAHLVMTRFDQTANNINSKLINSMVLNNCTFTKNGIGFKSRHPNYAHGPQSTYHLRYCNETTNITGNIFDSNHFSAILISSDEYELSYDESSRIMTSASEIHYNILDNKIRRNKDGIRQFSRDIRYAYNVFHWNIEDNVFDSNRGGGVNLMLPFFWRYDTNLSHTIETTNNSFFKNVNFEFDISGHFAMFNLTDNNFRENRCRNKLISVSGMEKRTFFRYNIIEGNICNRLIDFNAISHADKMGSIPTEFKHNSVRFNRRAISNSTYLNLMTNFKYPKLLPKLHPQVTDYALAVRGIQALNVTRNLFVNPDLRFELVAAILIDPDERTLNAIENYWGSLYISDINDRIFDFDDWNNYAITELSPFLVQESFQSATMLAESRDTYNSMLLSPRVLGGRLTKSIVLSTRKEPYVIESDLTVMPNVRLTIEKGVQLEFMPNVGILVLGELIAAGSRELPIQMRPLLGPNDMLPLRNFLFPMKTRPNITLFNLNDPQSYEHNYAYRHYHFSYPIDLGSVRLCKNEICNDGMHIYENNVEDPILRREVLISNNNTWKMDGFLEIFNMTRLQWVPVCDPLFTEHTARVICRQFGYSHLSLFRRGRRYTIEQEQLTSIKSWPESVSCEGDESSIASCPLATTGFMNHSTACHRESNQFIYVACHDFPDQVNINNTAADPSTIAHSHTSEHLHHWGGIRFACPTRTASTALSWQDVALVGTTGQRRNTSHQSRLQYVNIDHAGILHRHRSPALQVLQCNVQMEYVSVTYSAHTGIELITSNGNQNFHQLQIKNSVGVGFNHLSLTGSSSITRLVPYLPLKHLEFSTDIFGLVDICGASKEIRVEERLLLYHRYNSRPSDCVKIISSKLSVKHLGVRMLQFDLFNSTSYTSRPDHIRIYDGNIFDRDSRLLVELGVTERHRQERPELKFYHSSDSSMTIRLHASGSSSQYGFIAEVVTTPVSYNIQRDIYNNITFSEFADNKLGAMVISNAGESSSNLILSNNRYESNCLSLFGNFTSCASPIYMELQNCQRLRVSNNFMKNNQGGLMIKSYSHSAVSALDASLENNVFEGNQNINTLALLGPRTDPYQTVKVKHNYFTRNMVPYLSNIVLSRIVANFSGNIITSNVGRHQIEVVGFDKLPLSFQTFANNWIYNNTATYERDQSTIFGNSAGQQYYMNYLVNPDNHFEISTMNWSRYDVKPYQVPRDDEIIHLASGDGSSKDIFRKTADAIPLNIIESKKIDLYHSSINARHNWWGFNTTAAIQGRVRDRIQHEELIKVDFTPFLETNRSVLSGICAGGWQKVGQSCLVYIGTRMTYDEAQQFCAAEHSTLPLLRGNHDEITDFVQSQDSEYDSKVERIWVQSFDVSSNSCPAVNDYRTKYYHCYDKYVFLCEKNPYVVVTLLHWHRETGGLIALILSLITVILTCCCSACWLYKSRHRRKEKIERKNTLYASMRSNRGPYSSNNSLSEFCLHRQLYNNEKSSITDLSLSTQLTQPNSLSEQDGMQPSHEFVRLDPSGRSVSVKRNPSSRAILNSSSAYLQHHRGDLREQQHQIEQSDRPLPRRVSTSLLKPPSVTDSYSATEQQVEQEYQAAYNPAFTSTTPLYDNSIRGSRETFAKTPTPIPNMTKSNSFGRVPLNYMQPGGSTPPSHNVSFQEIAEPMHDDIYHVDTSSRISLSNLRHGQMAPTFDRLNIVPPPPPPPLYDIRMEPMPDAPAPRTELPPALSYQYSNIMLKDKQNRQSEDTIQDQINIDNDESGGSSVPTQYSNNTFEESTNSYLETYNVYNEAYGNTLTKRLHNKSYSITEKTSITDLIMHSSSSNNQATSTISDDNSQAELLNSRTRRTSDYDLIKMDPSGTSQQDVLTDSTDRAARYHYGSTPNNPQINRAYSDGGGYWLETSFDHQHSPASPLDQRSTPASNVTTSVSEYLQHQQRVQSLYDGARFGGSQQLSPIPTNLESASDSKQGSRVYLETTFE